MKRRTGQSIVGLKEFHIVNDIGVSINNNTNTNSFTDIFGLSQINDFEIDQNTFFMDSKYFQVKESKSLRSQNKQLFHADTADCISVDVSWNVIQRIF
jgi:hypothetical protein